MPAEEYVDLGWSDALSDLSDSDDASDAPAPRASLQRAAKKAKPAYTIQTHLRPPRTTQYTAESLYQMLGDGRIDVNPDYQRDIVWQDNKQSLLIDSILRNYYLPPIIFAVAYDADGNECRTCIDGKQRLTSIWRFIEAEISYKDSHTDERFWSKLPTNRAAGKLKVLPLAIYRSFLMKQVVCVEYDSLTADKEREIFQRVQLGVALTPAERMQAINGPHATFARDLLALITANGAGFTDWNQERGRGFQAMAVMIELAERYPRQGAWPGPPTLEKLLCRAEPIAPSVRRGLKEAARALVILAQDPRGAAALAQPARMAPVECVAVLMLLLVHRVEMGVVRAAREIKGLRKALRKEFRSDLKCNTAALRIVFKYIKGIDVDPDDDSEEALSRVIARVERLEKEGSGASASTARAATTEVDEPMAALKVGPSKSSKSAKTKKAASPADAMDVDEPEPRAKPIPKARRSDPLPRTTKRKRAMSHDDASDADSEDAAPPRRRAAPASTAAALAAESKPKKKALKPASCAATDFKVPSTPREAAAAKKRAATSGSTKPVASSSSAPPVASSSKVKLPSFKKKTAAADEDVGPAPKARPSSPTKRAVLASALPPKRTMSAVSGASSNASVSSVEEPLARAVARERALAAGSLSAPPAPVGSASLVRTLDPRMRPPALSAPPAPAFSTPPPPPPSISHTSTVPTAPAPHPPPPSGASNRGSLPPICTLTASAAPDGPPSSYPVWLNQLYAHAGIQPTPTPTAAPRTPTPVAASRTTTPAPRTPGGGPPSQVRRVGGPQTSSGH